MKVKCDYCRADIEDTDEKCPHCGADNSHLKKVGDGVPKTIEELKKWYVDHNLPDENITRFFIGKNYTKPKAFGIYKDQNTGNIIVYKNKGDGTRSVRYEGKDEVYAVNELYIKLKEEIINQKQHNLNNGERPHKKFKFTLTHLFIIFIALIMFVSIISAIVTGINTPSRGYYNYDGTYYYYQSGSWYRYYDDHWGYYTPPRDLEDNFRDYYSTRDYDYSSGVDDFTDSGYYKADSSSSSSSRSD